MPTSGKPNVLVLWGDDIGWWNISYNNRGQMGYRTPNIDRIGNEGASVHRLLWSAKLYRGPRRLHHRTESDPHRTDQGGNAGADVGIRAEDPTIAELLKPLGYATGQFGKNHLSDKDRVPSHGARLRRVLWQPISLECRGRTGEDPDYPKDPAFKKRFGPRGVLHSWANGKGGQKIEDTGPLTKKRMETIDDEVTEHALSFIDKTHTEGRPFFLWYNTTAMHFRTHCPEKHKGKSGGQGDYNDVMVAHDKKIGTMLSRIDDLGMADNTIVVYSTDNGPHYNTWPDAAISPFRSEKKHQLGGRLARAVFRALASCGQAGLRVQRRRLTPGLAADVSRRRGRGTTSRTSSLRATRSAIRPTKCTSTDTICCLISPAKRKTAPENSSSTSVMTAISWRFAWATGSWCSWSSARSN